MGEFDIIISPEFDNLRKSYEMLKEEFAKTLVEREHLFKYEYKRIKAKYNSEIGNYEQQVLQLKAESQKYISLINEIREIVKRGEIPTFVDTNEKEELEFEDSNLKKEDNGEKESELKNLYRKLAKIFHPDICGENNQWGLIMKAYEEGNIDVLTQIYEVMGTMEVADNSENSLVALKDKCSKLRTEINAFYEEMRVAKGKFPFNQEKILNDKKLIELRKEELKRELNKETVRNKVFIREYNALVEKYSTK